jgi:hypothetical protein
MVSNISSRLIISLVEKSRVPFGMEGFNIKTKDKSMKDKSKKELSIVMQVVQVMQVMQVVQVEQDWQDWQDLQDRQDRQDS